MKLALNMLDFKQFHLVDTGGPATFISLSLAGSNPLLECIVIFMGRKK